MILNPYNFVPLTAHINLELNHPNEFEHKCIQKVNLMALNDTFTIQEIHLDNKNLVYDFKQKELKAYWKNECADHPSKTIAKFIVINSLIFRYSYA